MRCIRDTYAMHDATHHANYISGLHPRISDSLLHLEVFALETLFRDGVAFYSATRLHQPPFRGSLYDNFVKNLRRLFSFKAPQFVTFSRYHSVMELQSIGLDCWQIIIVINIL